MYALRKCGGGGHEEKQNKENPKSLFAGKFVHVFPSLRSEDTYAHNSQDRLLQTWCKGGATSIRFWNF